MSQTYPIQLKPNKLAHQLLKLLGWKCSFKGLPGPHGVIIFYPHTSNWDFCIGILAKWAMDLEFKFLAKHTLFQIPIFGSWLRGIGGVPIIRHSSQGYVSQLAQSFSDSPYLWMAIAPEGTRRKTSGWKSGFYHIAAQANIPIGMAYLDYKNKEIGLTDFFSPSGDVDKDLIFFREFYKDKIGCHPENAAPIEFLNSSKP